MRERSDPLSAYLDTRATRTYYEAEGAGEPLLMLHGGLCAIETFSRLRVSINR